MSRRLSLLLPMLVGLLSVETAPPPTANTRSGAIAGTVVLAPGSESPVPRRVANTTDPDICGAVKSLDDLVVSPQLGIAHVIISLVDAPAVRPETPLRARRLVLDNRECHFTPHAAAITVGTVVELRNSDPTLHTVHWYGPTSGNVALPRGSRSIERRFSTPGLYAIKCDVHGWMQAFVRVLRHPFHTVSDGGGNFLIAGLPPGSYTLEAWHERLGFLRQRVMVEADETTRLQMTYEP